MIHLWWILPDSKGEQHLILVSNLHIFYWSVENLTYEEFHNNNVRMLRKRTFEDCVATSRCILPFHFIKHLLQFPRYQSKTKIENKSKTR